MKKQIIALLVIPFLQHVSAQTSGIVHYEEKAKLQIKVDGADEKLLENIPKERISQKLLYFTPEATLYLDDKNQHTTDDIEKQTEEGNHIMIKMQAPDDKVFCDITSKKLTEQRDFMSRKFLIESDFNQQQWKLTGNQKMILNYPCQEAILQDTSKKLIVWFTSAIPVFSGPNGYANLPGLILVADLDNGKRTLTATKIELKEIDKKLVVKPTDGKKVTKEAFNKLVVEKRKELEEENGGNGNLIIKVGH